MGRKRRKFTKEFKAEAVQLVRAGVKVGKTAGVIAKELDLTETALRAWVKQADVDAGRGPEGSLTTVERQELAELRKENRVLRMERDLLSGSLLREGELVRFELIEAEKATFPIAFMCGHLDVSTSGFYAWRKRLPSARKLDDERLLAEIRKAHEESQCRYGSPRVHRELVAKGLVVTKHRVERLMRENGLRGRRKRRFRHTTDSKHAMPVAPNMLEQNFTADAPNEVWVTDITYIPTREGWLYLAAILDLYSRRVVGWSMSDRITRQLALDALTMALSARTPKPGLVHHSDCGSQYASGDYRAALLAAGIECSMSRKGNCYDNAVAESFFASLKTELVHDAEWASRAEARSAIFEYLEVFYNRRRRHSSIGYVSPEDFELKYEELKIAA